MARPIPPPPPPRPTGAPGIAPRPPGTGSVSRRPSPLTLLVAGLCLVLIVLAGLSARAWWRQRAAAPEDRADGAAPASLRVVMAEVEGLPDQPPVLVGDTLVVRVLYAGGCEDPDIGLGRETRGDTLVFALDHDANGDDCTDEVYEELRLAAPDVPATGPVVLLDPETGERLRLR